MFLVFMHPDRKLDKKLFAKSDSTRQYQSKDGKKCFQGVPGKLRETEIYPPAFGRAVFETYTSKNQLNDFFSTEHML